MPKQKAKSKKAARAQKSQPPFEVFFRHLQGALSDAGLNAVLENQLPLGRNRAAAILSLVAQRLLDLLGSEEGDGTGLKGRLGELNLELEGLKAAAQPVVSQSPVSVNRASMFAKVTARVMGGSGIKPAPVTVAKARTSTDVEKEVRQVSGQITRIEGAIEFLANAVGYLQDGPAPVRSDNVSLDGQVDEASWKKFLHELRQLVGYVSRSEEPNLDDFLAHIRAVIKEKDLSAGGVHAFKSTLRALREYLGISDEEMRKRNLDTQDLVREFWRVVTANEEDLDLLADVARELTGDEKATREQIEKAFAELRGKSNNGTVRADDPRIQLLTFVLREIGLDPKAGRQEAESSLKELKAAQVRVEELEDFRSRTLITLLGGDDHAAVVDDVEKAVTIIKRKAGMS